MKITIITIEVDDAKATTPSAVSYAVSSTIPSAVTGAEQQPPELKKEFEVTRTGQYRTRNGKTAIVETITPGLTYLATGLSHDGKIKTWNKEGHVFRSETTSNDLVEFLG